MGFEATDRSALSESISTILFYLPRVPASSATRWMFRISKWINYVGAFSLLLDAPAPSCYVRIGRLVSYSFGVLVSPTLIYVAQE